MNVNNTKSPFGWCFIGSGVLGKKVAGMISDSGRHRIVSAYSRNYDKCASFAAKYGALACKNAKEAICAKGVEGVYIVTPHNSHHMYSKLAMELGKPVLCEKPMTVSAAETADLISLSRKNQVYLCEAMWTWFSPVANQIKTWLDEGMFGELIAFSLNCHMETRIYSSRVTDPDTAGGALLDLGVYPITYIMRLFGKPESVTCKGRLKGGIDMDEVVTLHYPTGASYTTSVSLHDIFGGATLKIQGTKASLTLPDFFRAGKVTLRQKQGKDIVFSGDGSYVNEFNLAASEIREGLTESRYIPLQSTLEVMEVLDECRRQMGLIYPFE